jgi:hypothetical protein
MKLSLIESEAPAIDVDAAFELFWKAYPYVKRTGKALARAKFRAIVTTGMHTKTLDKDSGGFTPLFLKATPEEILAGARMYELCCRKPGKGTSGYKDEGKYIKNPSTWLNQGCWEDGL